MSFIFGFVTGIVFCVVDSKYNLTEKVIKKVKEYFNAQ